MSDAPSHSTIGASTRLVVLLGHPVGHSRSPQLHNSVFARAGLDLAYLACDVPPERLRDAVAGLRGLNAAGANVTIPHKQAVVPLLDDLSDEARALGAVNTITNDGGRLTGHNTDVGGFLDGLTGHSNQLRGSRMLVWGAGGAALAVVYALLSLGPSRLTLVARRPEQAQALAGALAAYDPNSVMRVADAKEVDQAAQEADLLVNTTPLGTTGPLAEEMPWPAADFRTDQIAYDLVYTPEQTRFLREAASNGAANRGRNAHAEGPGRPRPPPLDWLKSALLSVFE